MGQITPLNFPRGSQEFEELRREVVDLTQRTGKRPLVRLFKLGGPKQWSAQAAFARGFFEVSGCAIDEAVVATTRMGETGPGQHQTAASVGVLCGGDADYLQFGPDIIKRLKVDNPYMKVFIAGSPEENEEVDRKDGVDGFVSQKTDCLAFLRKLIRQLEESD